MALTKKLPLLNSEAKQMRFLIGLYQEAENSQSVLKLRLAATNNAARLERVANEIKSIAGSLIMTIPDKKIGAFLASTRNMQMELHQTRDMDMSGEYTNIPTEAFRTVCAVACTEKCELCLGCNEDYEACDLRKALDAFLMVDVEKDMYRCPYKDFDWSENIEQST